ncbi:hypothetical protein B0H17DRAFT_1193510 [Mycena rosella]|uniref:Uncharacterized protein n=1 Tax=Mycena rosella TaxID=1033263 RepID=A0AAD7M7W1_MYCRO|nr:hypothetical protein B0H17DRAFT_1193510 [Mycena rosella]
MCLSSAGAENVFSFTPSPLDAFNVDGALQMILIEVHLLNLPAALAASRARFLYTTLQREAQAESRVERAEQDHPTPLRLHGVPDWCPPERTHSVPAQPRPAPPRPTPHSPPARQFQFPIPIPIPIPIATYHHTTLTPIVTPLHPSPHLHPHPHPTPASSFAGGRAGRREREGESERLAAHPIHRRRCPARSFLPGAAVLVPASCLRPPPRRLPPRTRPCPVRGPTVDEYPRRDRIPTTTTGGADEHGAGRRGCERTHSDEEIGVGHPVPSPPLPSPTPHQHGPTPDRQHTTHHYTTLTRGHDPHAATRPSFPHRIRAVANTNVVPARPAPAQFQRQFQFQFHGQALRSAAGSYPLLKWKVFIAASCPATRRRWQERIPGASYSLFSNRPRPRPRHQPSEAGACGMWRDARARPAEGAFAGAATDMRPPSAAGTIPIPRGELTYEGGRVRHVCRADRRLGACADAPADMRRAGPRLG